MNEYGARTSKGLLTCAASAALLVASHAAPADACSGETGLWPVWPTATSTAVPANTRILVSADSFTSEGVSVRFRIRALTSTATAALGATRMDSKFLSTPHPYAGLSSLWLADGDLTGLEGPVEVAAELVTEAGAVVASSTQQVMVVPGSTPPQASLTDEGAYFFRDPTFDEPFDSCSAVHANEGTSVFVRVQTALPAVVRVIPTYACTSTLSDPAYALAATGDAELRFSVFSRDCGQPTLRYELVDVLGRESAGTLGSVLGCAPGLPPANWSLAEWQANGGPCSEAVLDAGVADADVFDALTDLDASADPTDISADSDLACACTEAGPPRGGWSSVGWMVLGAVVLLRRRLG